MDLVVRHAQVLEHDGLVDIAVNGSEIASIKPSFSGEADREIDARGCLVLPTFVEPHVHLDKALLAERIPEAATIQEARERVSEAKRRFSVEDVLERARAAIEWALPSGVTFVRSHVDVDNIVRLTGVEALSKLRKEFQGLVDMQIVAFPQEGIVRAPGVSELLERAVNGEGRVMGGLPEAELNPEAERTHIQTVVRIAKELDVDLDVHCDVNPSTHVVEDYAAAVIKNGFQGRATADHLISLSYIDETKASEVIALLKRAKINVIANPCTMMMSGFTDHPPLGRGVTRIREIVRAGVNFSYGLDNIVDPYNPFGDFDTLRNGWLLAYQGQLNTENDMLSILKMNTYNAARTLRLPNYGIKPGCNADLNVLDEKSPREALRRRTLPVFVIKGGRVVAENQLRSRQGHLKLKAEHEPPPQKSSRRARV